MDEETEEENQALEPRNKLRPTTHHWLGFVIAAIAFVLYALTITPFPFPGESAFLITHHVGIDPLRPMSNPFYGIIARALAELPFSTLAFRLNLFSALCGGVSVWLVFELGYRFLYDREQAFHFKNMFVIRGAISATCFTVATPIWYASSRAHYAMFDLMLLLMCIYLITSYRRLGSRWRILAFGLLYAITTVEYPSALLWSIPLGLYLIFHMYHREDLCVLMLGVLLLCGLLSLSLYFLFSWQYYQLPIAEWRQVTAYIDVVKAMGNEQLTSFQRSLPRIGWLSIALMSLFPWLLSILFNNVKATSLEKKFGIYFFYLVVLAIGAAVFFNTIAAPWKLVGHTPLLVAPYALLAITLGWTISQWYARLLPTDDRGRKKTHGGTPPVRAGVTLIAPLIVALGASTWINFPQVEARSAGILHQYAEQVLDDLDQREWLLSANTLDDLISIAAWDRKQPVHLLNRTKDKQKTYRNYNASLFDSPRQQSLAKIGLAPLISEWFLSETNLLSKLAIEDRDELYSPRRIVPINHRTIIIGETNPSNFNSVTSYEIHQPFWDTFITPLQALQRQENPASPYARSLLTRLSRGANNLGTLTENHGELEVAQACYQQARTIYPDNLSALLNEYILSTTHSNIVANTNTIAHAESELRKEENRIGIRTMVYYFGHIQNRAAIEKLQDFWDIPEQTEIDRSPLKAIEEDYVAERYEDALSKARAYTDEHPYDEVGWNLLAVIAGRLGDELALQDCYARMQEMRIQWPFLLELLGRVELDKGNMVRGRHFLEQSLAAYPVNIRLMELLIKLDMQEKNLRQGHQVAQRLLALQPDNATANLMVGMIHFAQNDYNLAANALAASIERKPNSLALNNLAWILHLQEDNEKAFPFIKQAIDMDPSSFNAWDTMGMILDALGEPSEAEIALGKAIELGPDQINPVIHLAQLLANNDRSAEARELAGNALDKFADELTTKQKNQLSALSQL